MQERAMTSRLGRALPRGPLDLAWQCVLVVGAYYGWRYARGAVDGSTAAAIVHAQDLVSIEDALRSAVEPAVQGWAQSTGWAVDFASWMYANAHFKFSLLALVVIYFRFNRSFYFVRNMLLCAMALSLLGYAFFPTAPPRFLPGFGVEDTVAAYTGQGSLQFSSDPWFNAYAAVPSMHAAFALIFGWSLAALMRPWPLRAVLWAYPALITFVVVATGNHFWIDAFFGALVAAAAFGLATLLARLRPEQWSFRPRAADEPERAASPVPEAATA
jgi:membrane-associated phospholipid phosphatase